MFLTISSRGWINFVEDKTLKAMKCITYLFILSSILISTVSCLKVSTNEGEPHTIEGRLLAYCSGGVIGAGDTISVYSADTPKPESLGYGLIDNDGYFKVSFNHSSAIELVKISGQYYKSLGEGNPKYDEAGNFNLGDFYFNEVYTYDLEIKFPATTSNQDTAIVIYVDGTTQFDTLVGPFTENILHENNLWIGGDYCEYQFSQNRFEHRGSIRVWYNSKKFEKPLIGGNPCEKQMVVIEVE